MENIKEKKALSRKEKSLAASNAKAVKRLGKKTKIQESLGDRILLGFTDFVLILVLIIVGYPVIYVISCSFSSNAALSAGRVFFLPVEPSLASYNFVFQFEAVWQGYRNTIFYTVVGVTCSVIMQTLCAYPLSKRNYQGRNMFMAYFFITTMVGAGMIPTLLVRAGMGLRNNVFAVILVGLLSVHNMIIMRTAFQNSVPGELYDAAAIDGANDFQTLTKIALPLTKSTVSVLTLYCAVGAWNEYFTSMLYLPGRRDLWPLQLVLRPILTAAQSLNVSEMSVAEQAALENTGTEGVTFALIIVATVPVLLMYFVVQRYFEKGVMIGSVKG